MQQMTERERITQETYYAIASDWAREHGNTEYWRQEFEMFRRMMPRGRVLDIGCGYGRDYHFFRDAGYDYVGLDSCGNFLADMHARFPEAKLVQANMSSIPNLFRENSFNGFWAAASLLHIEKKDIKGVLNGIKRKVRPNGIGFISLKKGEGERIVRMEREGWASEDVRFFAYYHEREFTKILIDCGIAPIGIHKREAHEDTWLEFFVKCI